MRMSNTIIAQSRQDLCAHHVAASIFFGDRRKLWRTVTMGNLSGARSLAGSGAAAGLSAETRCRCEGHVRRPSSCATDLSQTAASAGPLLLPVFRQVCLVTDCSICLGASRLLAG